jgi:peptidoglycan/LPS O-acetylase OafA/YrhL
LRKLDALTGIRFFAALWVVFYHYGVISVSHQPGWQQDLEGTESIVAGGGYVGVNLFFVLSGFILAYTYVTPNVTLRHGAKVFWVARFARIYPVYLLGLLLAIIPTFSWSGCSSIKLACSLGDRTLTAISSVTLVQTWIPTLPIRWNQPSWSLSVEATFYLLFPFIVIPAMRMATNRCIMTIVGLWLFGIVVVATYLHLASQYAAANDEAWLQFMMFSPLIHLNGFLMGIVLYRAFQLHSGRGIPGKRIAGISNDLLVGSVILLTVLVLFSGQVPFLYLHSGILDPVFAVGIYILATGEGRFAALLSMPALLLLGEASYGMYIFHVPIADWLIRGIRHSGVSALYPDAHLAGFLALYIALLVAFSIASYTWLERPARRVIRLVLAGRKTS